MALIFELQYWSKEISKVIHLKTKKYVCRCHGNPTKAVQILALPLLKCFTFLQISEMSTKWFLLHQTKYRQMQLSSTMYGMKPFQQVLLDPFADLQRNSLLPD